MRKNKKREKASALEKCSGEFAGRMSIIEIHSDYELILSGCRGIVDYTCESVVADTVSGRISVKGKCLCLDVFRGDILCVSGRILSVNFEGTLC